MAANTSSNETTARRLLETLTGLWTACKNAFALKNGDYRSNGLQASYSSSSGYAASAGSATDSTYATKIGSSASHPAIGGWTTPVWVDSNGIVQECYEPLRWRVGQAVWADLARYVYSTEFGGYNQPAFIKATGQSNEAEFVNAFKIPHTVTKWHVEVNYPSATGVGIIHRTDKFVDAASSYLSLSLNMSSNNDEISLVVDGAPNTPWHGGQVWGTMKWDSQTGSNINSRVDRIGNSNLGTSTVLASRSISTSNVQDIQGHALFAICTGDFTHRYVVDMEISLIKPNASSTLCYITVMSKCSEVSATLE